MNPDDERIRNAMHNIEPGSTAGDDVPDLFERVAAGARRRRRRVASGASAAAAAAVVAAVAIVPAVTGNSHHTSRTTTAAQPGSATVMPVPLPSFVTPPATSPVSGSAHVVVRPSGPIVPVSPSSPASPPPPLATDSAGCPTEASLPPGPDAAALAEAAAVAAVPQFYGADAAPKAHVTSVYAASTGKGYGIAADGMCGKALGDNSYVVEFSFGSTDSASMGGGQLFLADFPNHGWQVWFQYH